MMTRKHFIKIAHLLNKARVSKAVCEEFANWLLDENELFDKERFLKACYWKPYEDVNEG